MNTMFTISAFSENSPGILQRITDLFTRRKVNIESLTVSETERKGISRFTIVVRTDETIVHKVARQIERVIEVTDVFVSENPELIYREIAFIKVSASSGEIRTKLESEAQRYGAQVAYATAEYLVFEKTGTEDEISSLYLLLEPHGVREFIRSGRIAIRKDDLPRAEERFMPPDKDLGTSF